MFFRKDLSKVTSGEDLDDKRFMRGVYMWMGAVSLVLGAVTGPVIGLCLFVGGVLLGRLGLHLVGRTSDLTAGGIFYRKGGAAHHSYSRLKALAIKGQREEAIQGFLEVYKEDPRDQVLRDALFYALKKPVLDALAAQLLQELIKHPSTIDKERQRFRDLLSTLQLDPDEKRSRAYDAGQDLPEA